MQLSVTTREKKNETKNKLHNSFFLHFSFDVRTLLVDNMSFLCFLLTTHMQQEKKKKFAP